MALDSADTLPKTVELSDKVLGDGGKEGSDFKVALSSEKEGLEETTTTVFTSSKTTHVEKHKVVQIVQEQAGSPMDSPLTESGHWTESGISTAGDTGSGPGAFSSARHTKPVKLSLLPKGEEKDDSIDTTPYEQPKKFTTSRRLQRQECQQRCNPHTP